MKNKRSVSYILQSNLDGGYDIVQNISQGKIIAHTESEEAAKEIIRIMSKKSENA